MDQWKIRNKEEEYSISFSHNLVEKCLGQYSRINKKMKETDPVAVKWMLETKATIEHPIGSFSFTLHLNYDRNVIIYSTDSNRMQAHNINDIRFLRKAIVWMGWQNLMVTPSEVDSSLDFWKRCWETGLIESEYLEKKFRKR